MRCSLRAFKTHCNSVGVDVHNPTQISGVETATLNPNVGGTKNRRVIFTQVAPPEALQIHDLRVIHKEIHLNTRHSRIRCHSLIKGYQMQQ